MKIENKKDKKFKNKWLRLSVYENCFKDGSKRHLGLCFRGTFYCITHREGNGVLVPESCLKMDKISPYNEYLKRCIVKPRLIHETKMFLSKSFMIKAILDSVISKLLKEK